MSDEGQARAPPEPGSDGPEDSRFRGKRYRQLVAGFNVYRTSGIVAETVAPPRIHTSYRGVPFSSDATVLSVSAKEVTFSADPLQINAVVRTDVSLITSPLHGMTFRAAATDIDVERSQATFREFLEQRRGGPEQRSNLRVEPSDAIEVQMSCLGHDLAGELVDVSVVSLAVCLREVPEECLQEGAPVRMRVPSLPGTAPSGLEAAGEIIRTMPVNGDRARRVVVYLRVDPELYDRLDEYVSERRAEIVRELTGPVESTDSGLFG